MLCYLIQIYPRIFWKINMNLCLWETETSFFIKNLRDKACFTYVFLQCVSLGVRICTCLSDSHLTNITYINVSCLILNSNIETIFYELINKKYSE